MPAITIAADVNDMFIEGQDYVKLADKIRQEPVVAEFLATKPNKVQVIFFFNYGCHACEAFNVPFEKWIAKQKAAKNSKFVIYKYPVSFNEQWKMLAKVYFVLEYLDPKLKLNDEVFDGIHKQGLRLWQEPVMKKFFIKHGYSEKEVEQALNAPIVTKQIKYADDLSKAYQITETPDIIVNGPMNSYMMNVVKAGNNVDRLFKILDYVIRRETKLLS